MIAGKPELRIPTQVLFRKVKGQMVLLNLETEQYYGLNDVGADMVTRILASPLTEVVPALSDDYGVDTALLERDLRRLVDDLLAAGLLEQTGDPD